MANDLTQLIFNVIAITGVTSLAVICNLLKRDNEKLAVELRERNGHALKIRTRRSTWQIGAPKKSSIVSSRDVAKEDIRQYVGQRLQKWIEIQQTAAKA